MKTIIVMTDSLNRNYLPLYGNDWVKTPNIDRFAEISVTMENHWLGSAPTMPTRRDLLTGRLHFLERGWGGLEPFDIPLTRLLREAGVFCHLETDSYHYFHVGGEGYFESFDTWAFHRGQEFDPFASKVSSPEEPDHLGRWAAQYAKNQMRFKTESDFSTPMTFTGAVEWLKENEGEDNYLLWVEVFDPHEPFDCPREFVEAYGDDWDGPLYFWSEYDLVDEDSDAVEHLRRRYAGVLTMLDKWFGKLLDEIERQGILQDALILFTTDHGHMLGERGCTGKNKWHVWNQLGHIPLIIHLPGSWHAGERRTHLSQNIDILPTVMDYFDLEFGHRIHGRSLREVMEKDAPSERRAALYGWFGQTVNLTDGKYTYFRAAAREDNQPLYRHFLSSVGSSYHDLPSGRYYEGAEFGSFLPYAGMPVLRAPAHSKRNPHHADTRLYDIENDYAQENDLAGTEMAKGYEELLVQTMKGLDSPSSQFERLGLRAP